MSADGDGRSKLGTAQTCNTPDRLANGHMKLLGLAFWFERRMESRAPALLYTGSRPAHGRIEDQMMR